MAQPLAERRVAFLATDGVEQVELTGPWEAVSRAGGEPVLVSIRDGSIQGFHHLDRGDRFPVDALAGDVHADNFAGLVLPGGVANPDALRTSRDAVRLVREFMSQGKPVAAICHGPWLLVEADAVRGRTLTSWPSLRTDIANAGGEWVDREVVVDGRLVTSRKPEDLGAFCRTLVERFGEAAVNRQVDQSSEMSFPASDPPAY